MSNLEQLRDEIKQIDVHIIELLAKRLSVAKQIGQLKLTLGKDVIDLAREKNLFALYDELSKKHHLSSEFVSELFKHIIAHSQAVQKQ